MSLLPEDPSSIERALAEALSGVGGERYRLSLYVAGTSARSQLAVANLRRICQRFLGDRHDLEIVDIYQQTEKAKAADVVGTPTLVKSFPLPLRRLVGDLSDETRVLHALGLAAADG